MMAPLPANNNEPRQYVHDGIVLDEPPTPSALRVIMDERAFHEGVRREFLELAMAMRPGGLK